MMTAKADARRETLRERILEAAEARIVGSGIATLRARDVMADAGAALGGLYNAFADLDDVVLHVNARTLARLREALADASAAADPVEALAALALAYLRFAKANRSLWSALFEYRFGTGRTTPDWHLAQQGELLVHIAVPLQRLRPNWSEETLMLRARTLFGAIHGIVSISIEGRFVGLGGADLDREIAGFVTKVAAGLRGSEATADQEWSQG